MSQVWIDAGWNRVVSETEAPVVGGRLVQGVEVMNEQMLRRIIREELQSILKAVVAPAPVPLPGERKLDPVQVQLEDRKLLELQRTLPENEYKAEHARIMASRAEILGYHQQAEKLRKRAISLLKKKAA